MSSNLQEIAGRIRMMRSQSSMPAIIPSAGMPLNSHLKKDAMSSSLFNANRSPRRDLVRCARCKVSLEDASLALVCHHHICILCAIHALSRPSGMGPLVQCQRCHMTTHVDEESARYLEAWRNSSSMPSSSSRPKQKPNGSDGTRTRSCGQCEQEGAKMFCEQCQEFLCRSCATALHKRGRMVQHYIRLLADNGVMCATTSERLPSDTSRASSNILSPRLRPLDVVSDDSIFEHQHMPELERGRNSSHVPLGSNLDRSVSVDVGRPAQTFRCAVHPDEPVHFFCLNCPECMICIECKNGEHASHEIVTLRTAAKQLQTYVLDLQGKARMTEQHLVRHNFLFSHMLNHVAARASQCRSQLHKQMEAIHIALDEEEASMIDEISKCSAALRQHFDVRFPQHKNNLDGVAEELEKRIGADAPLYGATLDTYVRLANMIEITPIVVDHGRHFEELKCQLEEGFRSRMFGINRLSNQFGHVDGFFSDTFVRMNAQNKTTDKEVKMEKQDVPYSDVGRIVSSQGVPQVAFNMEEQLLLSSDDAPSLMESQQQNAGSQAMSSAQLFSNAEVAGEIQQHTPRSCLATDFATDLNTSSNVPATLSKAEVHSYSGLSQSSALGEDLEEVENNEDTRSDHSMVVQADGQEEYHITRQAKWTPHEHPQRSSTVEQQPKKTPRKSLLRRLSAVVPGRRSKSRGND